MKNEVLRRGTEISLPVPAGTKSGDVVMVGKYKGVAATDRQEAMAANVVNTTNPVGYASVWLEGVYEVPCADAVSGPGVQLYVTGAGPFTVTTTATAGNELGLSTAVIKNGVAVGASKAAGAGTIYVNLGR